MHLFSRKYLSLTILFLLIAVLVACDKEDWNPVPLVEVDFRINLEFQYIELNSPGGWVNVFGGFGGIVIYRISIDQFTAFDRACPLHPYDINARVTVDNPPLAKCPVCESEFLLLDGSVILGPARHPLRPYRTFFNNPFLSVTN